MKLKTLIMLAACLLLAGTAFGQNSLSVNENAAMSGVGGTACNGSPCGLEVLVQTGQSNAAKVVDDTPADEAAYRAQFWMSFNDMTQNDATFWALGRGTALPAFGAAIQVLVIKRFGLWRLFLRGQTNSGADRFSERINLSDAEGREPFMVQVTFEQSSAPGTPGGEVTMTLLECSDGSGGGTGDCGAKGQTVTTAEIFGEGINNSNLHISDFHWGAVGNVAGNLNGSFYLDEFASFRTLGAE